MISGVSMLVVASDQAFLRITPGFGKIRAYSVDLVILIEGAASST
jgi:hypothetical protein